MRVFSPNHQLFRDARPTARSIEPGPISRFAKPLTLAAMSLGYGVVQLDVTI
jgi:hypothetical protein